MFFWRHICWLDISFDQVLSISRSNRWSLPYDVEIRTHKKSSITRATGSRHKNVKQTATLLLLNNAISFNLSEYVNSKNNRY